jgi:hypothetical protein
MPAMVTGAVAIALVLVCGNVYITAQMPFKRHRSIHRSPIWSNLGAVLGGIGKSSVLFPSLVIDTPQVSVRAYGAQEMFREISHRRIDSYARISRPYWDLNRSVLTPCIFSLKSLLIDRLRRWLGFRLELLGGFFAGTVAMFLIYSGRFTASTVGFTLALISSFTDVLLIWIRQVNRAEVEANRCDDH